MIGYLPEKGTLLAGDKMSYRLGPLIAEGGEGKVYDVDGRVDVVAKIYKESDYTRAEKLRIMIDGSTRGLRKVAAWPLSTLTDSGGSTVGFVMESLTGWQPLHNVYQIRSRLKIFPHRSYQFLVRVARNLATCAHHVHEGGLVIGDLNESNVLVSSGAMVKIIDADSFQVPGKSCIHACKVGKPELLPPELQNHSLEGVIRTPEHDRFSLAVLVFETLVYGRHPFAGTPIDDQEITLEQCIARGYYAYTTKRQIRQKPPRNLGIAWLPEDIRELFERAFDPATEDRPTAKEWYFALKELENNLCTCRENPSHAYWNKLSTCPWCTLEDAMNLALFRPALIGPEEEVEIGAILSQIDNLPMPVQEAQALVDFDYRTLEPARISPLHGFGSKLNRNSGFYFWAVILMFNLMRNARLAFLAIALVVFIVVVAFSLPYEFLRWRINRANRGLDKLKARWNAEASTAIYQERLAYYQSLANALKDVKQEFERERELFVRDMHRPELLQFLQKFSILIANAGSLGSERLSYLHDHGIATAADIDPETFRMLPRIMASNEKQELMAWRQSLEAQFWKSRQYRLTVHQERQLILKVRKENERKKAELEHAPVELEDLRQRLSKRQLEIAEEAYSTVQMLRQEAPRLLAYERRTTKQNTGSIWTGKRF